VRLRTLRVSDTARGPVSPTCSTYFRRLCTFPAITAGIRYAATSAGSTSNHAHAATTAAQKAASPASSTQISRRTARSRMAVSRRRNDRRNNSGV
jgi:hypothetical protein